MAGAAIGRGSSVCGTYRRTGTFPAGLGMSKSSDRKTGSAGYPSIAEVLTNCRDAATFSPGERDVVGAGWCAAFAWNCSKRVFTCGSSSLNNGQLSFFWDDFSMCDQANESRQ